MDRTRRTKGEVHAYHLGYRTALHDFAWWKDGVQYVGSGVYTFAEMYTKSEEVERQEVAKLG